MLLAQDLWIVEICPMFADVWLPMFVTASRDAAELELDHLERQHLGSVGRVSLFTRVVASERHEGQRCNQQP